MDYLEERLQEDEKEARKYLNSGRIARVIYAIILCVSLILIFAAGTGIPIGIFAFFMLGASQGNYEKGKKLLALIQCYRLYAEKLRGKQTAKVEDLSELFCKPAKTVLANLNDMMQRGYIYKVEEGADYYRYAYIRDTAIQLPDDEERVMVAVTCEACGGVTQIPKGRTGLCAYCDSKIKA